MGKTTKRTTEDFIREARAVHGDRYDYSKVVYTGCFNKVEIICPKHGSFFQTANDHLQRRKCPKCGNEARGNARRLTTEDFVKKAKKIHGDKYDYSKVEYIHSGQDVVIICPKHGEFSQSPDNHYSGKGCYYCGLETLANHFADTKEEFIAKARLVHGDKFDYSLVDYINNSTKVVIICPDHGHFEQSPSNHLAGKKCYECSKEEVSKHFALTKEEFIERANQIHHNTYCYDEVKYINNNTKVAIICLRHGVFEQLPGNHLAGNGCPSCCQSNGEKRIARFLAQFTFVVIREKTFKKCNNIYCLPFDFYFSVGENKFLIEYDGQQHFEPVECWGGEKALQETRRRDDIKNQFAKKYGFILIRIPYTETNVEAVLVEQISQHIGDIFQYLKTECQHRVSTKDFYYIKFEQLRMKI